MNEDTSGFLNPPNLVTTAPVAKSEKKLSDTGSYIFRTPVVTQSTNEETSRRVIHNNWTRENEEDVKGMGQRAGGFKWLHGQCAIKRHKLYNVIGFCAIIANAIANALDIPTVIACK